MSFACPLWEIDDGKLAYYYTAQSTESGIYYTLTTPTPGYPEDFFADERDEKMRSHNRQLQMVESSGNQAKRDRGKVVDDDTTLPSQRIAKAEYISEVESSGRSAQRKRGHGSERVDAGKEAAQNRSWSEWIWEPRQFRYYRSRVGDSGDLEYSYDYETPGPAF